MYPFQNVPISYDEAHSHSECMWNAVVLVRVGMHEKELLIAEKEERNTEPQWKQWEYHK